MSFDAPIISWIIRINSLFRVELFLHNMIESHQYWNMNFANSSLIQCHSSSPYQHQRIPGNRCGAWAECLVLMFFHNWTNIPTNNKNYKVLLNCISFFWIFCSHWNNNNFTWMGRSPVLFYYIHICEHEKKIAWRSL